MKPAMIPQTKLNQGKPMQLTEHVLQQTEGQSAAETDSCSSNGHRAGGGVQGRGEFANGVGVSRRKISERFAKHCTILQNLTT